MSAATTAFVTAGGKGKSVYPIICDKSYTIISENKRL